MRHSKLSSGKILTQLLGRERAAKLAERWAPNPASEWARPPYVRTDGIHLDCADRQKLSRFRVAFGFWPEAGRDLFTFRALHRAVEAGAKPMGFYPFAMYFSALNRSRASS